MAEQRCSGSGTKENRIRSEIIKKRSKKLKLTEISQEIREMFSEFDKENHPGTQIGITYKGKIIFEHNYGLADMERNVEITSESLFDIASMSKQFVAVCIMLMEKDGLLKIEDSVHSFFPDLEMASEPIKIKNLLNHTSGIPDYMDLLEEAQLSFSNIYRNNDMLKLIFDAKVKCKAGEKFDYSNSNYFLLSQIIELVTKCDFSEYVNNRIFKPLKMDNSCFYPDHKKIVPKRVLSYKNLKNGDIENYPYIFNIVGDTGLLSNARDLVKWCNCFYQTNESGIDNSVFKDIQTKSILGFGDDIYYGYGLFIGELCGYTSIGHDGAAAGYRSEMLIIPEKEISIICLSNFTGIKRVVNDIATKLINHLN